MAEHFLPPIVADKRLQFIKFVFRKIQTLPLDVFVPGHPSNRSFLSQRAAVRAIDDPLQHAHIFAEARPHKISVLVFAKPVHVKYSGSFAKRTLHKDPMTKIITRGPVESLIHERHGRSATSAEDDRADWYAVRVFPIRIDRRTLLRRGRE